MQFSLKEKGNKKYFNINLLGLYLVHTTETNNKRARKKHASFSIQKFQSKLTCWFDKYTINLQPKAQHMWNPL